MHTDDMFRVNAADCDPQLGMVLLQFDQQGHPHPLRTSLRRIAGKLGHHHHEPVATEVGDKVAGTANRRLQHAGGAQHQSVGAVLISPRPFHRRAQADQ